MIWYGEYDKIPNNYMEAVGQELSKNDYPELFNAIAYQYGGSGDNFNLPNMRKDGIGRVPVQLDGGTFNTLGKTGGAETHTLTIDEMPSHDHGVDSKDNAIPRRQWSATGNDSFALTSLQWNSGSSYPIGSTQDVGGGQAHNNLQPYFTVFYIIKVRPEAYSEDLRNLDNEVQEINQVLNQNNSNYFKLPNGFIIIYGNATGAVDANPNGSYDCIFHFPDNIIFDNVDDYSVSAIARDFANHKRNVARSNYDLANQRDYVMVNVDASQTVVEFTIVGKLGGE